MGIAPRGIDVRQTGGKLVVECSWIDSTSWDCILRMLQAMNISLPATMKLTAWMYRSRKSA